MKLFQRLTPVTAISILLYILAAGIGSVSASQPLPQESNAPLERPLQVISTNDMMERFSSLLIIDVRSSLEFDVMHIQGAYNITMSTKGFEITSREICGNSCTIVTYCNGFSCQKSRLAAKRLMAAGFTSVYAYIYGIENWLDVYPEKTILLDKRPANKSDLISEDEFKLHSLNAEEFTLRATQKDSILVDIRDNFQSQGLPKTDFEAVIEVARHVPLDRFRQAIENGFAKDKDLYIFDAVGKQVLWLQYFLKLNGYENYYFLAGGIKSTTQTTE